MSKTAMQNVIEKYKDLLNKTKSPEIKAIMHYAIEVCQSHLPEERQQIIDAYNYGQQIPPFDYAEQYYNETYDKA